MEKAGCPFRYWTTDHPAIATFRWIDKPWGSSWSFLVYSIAIYLVSVLFLSILFRFKKSPLPLGPIPILHNLILLLGSTAMFVGCAQSATAEVEENGATWLLCFPVGFRASGRVFFWSYLYYLSKIYELLDTLIVVLRKRRITLFHVLEHAGGILVAFSWLEYVQSSQVVILLASTGLRTFVYGYFFLSSLGFNPPWKKCVTQIQILQLFLSLTASAAPLYLQYKEGKKCSGLDICIYNSLYNLVLMLLLMNYYRRNYLVSNTSKSKRRSKKE